jgi:hypothetical protein
MSAAMAWEHHRDRLANTIRTLRRRNYSGADNLAASLDSIDALLEPTAGDLVRTGWDVDEALKFVDRHVRELHSRMGGRP